MEHLALLLRGVGIGILFSVPVGPVNVMCIREAFQFGFRIGLAASFGAVTADVTFAAFAAFGLTAVADLVEGHTLIFQTLAALVLILIGAKVARSKASIDLDSEPQSARRAALTGFGMTVTNPTTILAFIAVFASLGPLAPDAGDYAGALFLVAGVAAGGFGWWFVLVTLIASIRKHMTVRALVVINHAAGAILALCGLGLLARVLWVVL